MSDLRFRKELAAKLPWVKLLKKPVPCDGIKWSKVTLKHIYSMNGNPPEGIPDTARCKKVAHWKFRALKKSMARSGNYCWTHLLYRGIYGDLCERERTDAWLAMYAKENAQNG
jgi:hypothetical protein